MQIKKITCVFRQCGHLKRTRYCLFNIETVGRKIVYHVSLRRMGNARGQRMHCTSVVLPEYILDILT